MTFYSFESSMFDIIIIGGGCMGTASAYYSAKSGNKTLLIEQFSFGHNNGSSHGYSRIIRKSYAERYFVEMMHQAYDLWHDLETASSTTLIIKTGGLDFGRIGDSYLERTVDAVTNSGIAFELLSAAQIRERFPMITVPDDYKGIYQPDAGVLNPYQSLEVIRNLAKQERAELHEEEQMLSFEEKADLVVVKTSKGEYTTKKLIITIGAWIKQFLDTRGMSLKADIWKLSLGYYDVKVPENFKPSKFPIFIAMDGPIFYGFPILEQPGRIKVAPHFTNEIIDIKNRTFEPNHELISKLNEFVANTFKDVYPTPNDLDTCLYTYTPDENFILDYLPNSKNIIIGAGFSGHGFKFTPLIGKSLVELAMNKPVGFDLTIFQLSNQL